MIRDEFGTFDAFFGDPYCSWKREQLKTQMNYLDSIFLEA